MQQRSAGDGRRARRRALITLLAACLATAGLSGTARPSTVRADAPTLTLWVNASPVLYGFPTGIRVTAASLLSEGTYRFTADGTTIPGCDALAVQPGFTYCGARLDPGSYTIQAFYSGGGGWDPASSQTESISISRAGTAVTYTGPTSVPIGVPFTASAALGYSGYSYDIEGQTVTFSFPAGTSATTSCSAVTAADGTASCSLVMPATAQTLTTSFAGTTGYDPSSDADVVGPASDPTTTTITGAAAAPWGLATTLAATVAPAGATGTVLFTRDAPPGTVPGCSAVPVVAGVATCAVIPAAGVQQFTAAYSGDGTHDPSSDTFGLTGSAHVVTLVFGPPATATVGQSLTLSARLDDTTAGGTTVDGATLTFSLGAATCTATTGAAGTASCSLLPATTSATQVVVAHTGDARYGAAGASRAISVGPAATGTTVVAPPGEFGVAVTLTATVSPTPGGGTVAFDVDGAGIAGCGAVALVGATATCTTAALPAGSGLVTATFSGDPDHSGSSGSATSSIDAAPVVITYTGDAAAAVGDPLAVDALLVHATTSAPVVGRTVQFAWMGQVCSGTTGPTGHAGCTLTVGAVADGAAPVTFAFAGDTEYLGGSGSTTVEVERAATVTSLATPAPAAFTEPVQLEATVAPTDGTGTVAFTQGGAAIAGCGAVALVADGPEWRATCTTDALSAGSPGLAAAYGGNDDYAPSGGTATASVLPAATEIDYTGATGAVVGEPVALSAVLREISGAPSLVAGETLTFAWAGSSCSGTTGGDGTASCSLVPAGVAAAGPVTVSFAGTPEYGPASSADATIGVQPAATVTAIDPVAAVTYGEPTLLRATVAPTDGSGTVTFSLGGQVLAGCGDLALTADGAAWVATCSAVLPAGQPEVTAAFGGTPDHLSSSGSATATVSRAPTALAYTGAPNGTVAHALTLSAQLTALPAGGAPVAGATLQFSLGDRTCTATTDASGAAGCDVTPVAIGDDDVLVAFAGDGSRLPAQTTATVALVPTATLVTLDAPPSTPFATPVTLTATVQPSDGVGTVSFHAGGVPIDGCAAVPLAALAGGGEGAWQASCTASGLTLGAHPLSATFSGAPGYLGGDDSATLAVVAAATTLAYTGPDAATVGAPVELSAVLSAGEGESTVTTSGASLLALLAADPVVVAGQVVHFALGGSTCDGTTSPIGAASCTLTPASTSGSLVVRFDGSPEFLPVELVVPVALSPAAAPTAPTDPAAPTDPPAAPDPGQPTAPSTPPVLPATGSAPAPAGALAGSTLIAGLLAWAAGRRRRTTPG